MQIKDFEYTTQLTIDHIKETDFEELVDLSTQKYFKYLRDIHSNYLYSIPNELLDQYPAEYISIVNLNGKIYSGYGNAIKYSEEKNTYRIDFSDAYEFFSSFDIDFSWTEDYARSWTIVENTYIFDDDNPQYFTKNGKVIQCQYAYIDKSNSPASCYVSLEDLSNMLVSTISFDGRTGVLTINSDALKKLEK